jgi:PhnB protein
VAERLLADELNQIIESVIAGAAPGVPGVPGVNEELPAELRSAAEVAGMLRHLPSEDFRRQLKTELQRSIAMNAGSQVRAAGLFHAVSPVIIHERAPELVDFLKSTFDAEEVQRKTGEEVYGFYSEVRVGRSVLMIGGGSAAQHGNLPGAFHVFVDDCDAVYRRALHAGATTLMGAMGEPADRPYGERSAFVEDGFGNYWYIATRLIPVGASEEPAADPGSLMPYLHPAGARKYIAFLRAAFGAEEMAVMEHAGRVMHAAVRIGDAVLEMGEPENRAGIPGGGFFLRVDDVEAASERAVAAGATMVRPPADIPYGYRSAIVKDPEGFLWWTARSMAR